MIIVAVLGGGQSPEHDVSLASADAVLRELDRNKWLPWPVFISRDGTWHVPPRPCTPHDGPAPLDAALGAPLRPGVALGALLDGGVQIVFPALHGRGGEDGSLQGMLELHDLAFVGSGTAASAIGMDKLRTRECLRAHDVPMPRCVTGALDRHDLDAVCDRIERDLGLPCFIKADLSGSSFGVARCDDRAEVHGFLATQEGRRFVAEERLAGEEISVAVLGNTGEALQALPPIGIYPRSASWFDAHAKYTAGGSDEIVPPRGLDARAVAAVQDLARTCHTALVCDGVSRTDMIVTVDGPRVLEVNTLPGLTAASLLPKCAQAAGLSFPALLDALLEAGQRRHAQAWSTSPSRGTGQPE